MMDKAVAKKIAPVLDAMNKIAVNRGEAFKNNLRTAAGLIQAVVTTLMTQGIYFEVSAMIADGKASIYVRTPNSITDGANHCYEVSIMDDILAFPEVSHTTGKGKI